MSVVCVDTQILFWAIEQRGTDDQQLLVFAPEFMKLLEARGDTIILPTIVFGELIVPIEDSRVNQFASRLKSDWRIVEYDVRCALQFARMRRDHALKTRMKSLQELEGCTRTELVADVMIIATAIANSADIIYSHDKALCGLADGWIEAKDFMTENIQRPMNLRESDEQE